MKHILTLVLLLLLPVVASAYDAKINGIYYSFSENEATVTFQKQEGIRIISDYSGSIVIPETVNYAGTVYSVTSIGSYAFNNCSGLTSVTIPNSVTSIGIGAFCDCSDLTSVTIPNSVTSIGYRGFYGCSGLTSVTIPNSVTSISGYAFWGCSGLTSIKVETGNTMYDSRNNCNAIIETATNTLIVGCQNTFIPNSVTSIGNYAFGYCWGLTSITIPNSVTSIGSSAFYGCSSLTSVTIPNSVTSIGGYAFWGCSGLTSVTIPNSVTSIGGSAFFGCSSLQYNEYDEACYLGNDENPYVVLVMAKSTDITVCDINAKCKFIYESAFVWCNGLTSVNIPNSVTSIDDEAFYGCSGLTSIKVETGNTKYDSRNNCNAIIETATNTLIAGCQNTIIPNSVTSIGNYAFGYCWGLTSITIPNSVTSIGEGAFSDCSGLTSVTIPNSVTSIGGYAFYKCSDLTDVYCYTENVPSTNSDAFYLSSISSSTLHVPAASVEAYSTSSPWNEFGTIVALTEVNGDLNDDDKVDIADAVCVLDVMAKDVYDSKTDLNEDGKIDIADFVCVLDKMAQQ